MDYNDGGRCCCTESLGAHSSTEASLMGSVGQMVDAQVGGIGCRLPTVPARCRYREEGRRRIGMCASTDNRGEDGLDRVGGSGN